MSKASGKLVIELRLRDDGAWGDDWEKFKASWREYLQAHIDNEFGNSEDEGGPVVIIEKIELEGEEEFRVHEGD